MAKRALVVGINDYSNWNNGATVNGLVLTAPNLSCDIADATDFAQLLNDAFLFDSVAGFAGYCTGDPERHEKHPVEQSGWRCGVLLFFRSRRRG